MEDGAPSCKTCFEYQDLIGTAIVLPRSDALLRCGYLRGVAAVGPDKVVIAKDNNFLFGAFRSVYVCKVTDNGRCSDRHEQESP